MLGINYDYNVVHLGETKAIEVNIHSNQSLKLTAVYKSPQVNPSEFNMNLLQYLQRMERASKQNMITGDINIDLLSSVRYVATKSRLVQYVREEGHRIERKDASIISKEEEWRKRKLIVVAFMKITDKPISIFVY